MNKTVDPTSSKSIHSSIARRYKGEVCAALLPTFYLVRDTSSRKSQTTRQTHSRALLGKPRIFSSAPSIACREKPSLFNPHSHRSAV